MKASIAILLLLNQGKVSADYKYLQLSEDNGLYINDNQGYEFVAVDEEQGVYVNKKMGEEDMQKTDFEMIFDEHQQSLVQKNKKSHNKKNSLNEIKKLEKETDTGSIDFDDADQEMQSLKKEFKGKNKKTQSIVAEESDEIADKKSNKKSKKQSKTKKSNDSIEHKLKKASEALNADEEKNDIEGETDFKKSGKNHHGQKEEQGELSGREHFNRPEKDRRNNYNSDIIARLSKTSQGLQKDQGEPQEEVEDKNDQLQHNSDYFHEKTFSNKAEGDAMERKISSFKRNRRRHGSIESREAREANGDQDDVAEEEESDNENRKNRDDEEQDFENVKKSAGKHRIRKTSDRWETEPQDRQGENTMQHEEHPDWRSNWRPWLRAKAIRGGGSEERSSEQDNEDDQDEQSDRPQKRQRHRRSNRSEEGDQEENNDDDSSERQIIDTETGKPLDSGRHKSVYKQLKHLNKKSANIVKTLGETLKP